MLESEFRHVDTRDSPLISPRGPGHQNLLGINHGGPKTTTVAKTTTDSFHSHGLDPNYFNSNASKLQNTQMDTSFSSCNMLESSLETIKPVMRRNMLHNRNNAIVTWKSFEIIVISQTYVKKDGVDNSS